MIVAFLRGNTLYALTTPGSWLETRAVARQLGGDLVRIDDSGENSDLQREFSGGFWIGLNTSVQQGSWRWSIGDNASYTNWAPSEPSTNSGSNHAWMVNGLAYGQWAARDGDAVDLPGLMELPVIQRQNRAYLLAEAGSWDELQRLASALGGRIASIGSNDTNDWLKRELPGLVQRRYGVSAAAWGRHPLIGLHDSEGNGNWNWTDGSGLALAPWAQGEPSDSGASERYGQLLISGAQAGRWNDSRFNGVGLLEVPLRSNQAATGRLVVTGAPEVGRQLQVQVVGLSDGDRLGATSIQWQRRHQDRRGWQVIEGAQGQSYTVTDADAGLPMRAVLSFRDGAGNDEVIISPSTNPGVAASPTTTLELKGGVAFSNRTVQLQLQRRGSLQGSVQCTIAWPSQDLRVVGLSPLVELLPAAIRLRLPAGQPRLNVALALQSEVGVGFVQMELDGVQLDPSDGVNAQWLSPRTLVRILDPAPMPVVQAAVLADPAALPDRPDVRSGDPFDDYVLNYGPSLLESWRQTGTTSQRQTWGERHYNGSGKGAGRQIEPAGDTMDWGAAVLHAPGLFRQWREATKLNPGLSAFEWGATHQRAVASAARVHLGTANSDRLQGPLVFGLAGNDVLTGSQMNDLLVGGYGDDVLTGGGLGGHDWMYGGPGQDQFVVDGKGTAWIRDFTPGEDALKLGPGLDPGQLKMEDQRDGRGSRLISANGDVLANLVGVTAIETGWP